MVYVFVIPFVVLVVLGFLLSKSFKTKSKRQKAAAYGKAQFDIELPKNADASGLSGSRDLPPLAIMTEKEAFYALITSYFGSLHQDKRSALLEEIEKLSADLKMDKNVYRFFYEEAEKYEGLSDEEASDKWRGKEPEKKEA